MDQIIIGVDMHKSNHIAVAINTHCARLGTMAIPTTLQGYRRLEAQATEFGAVKAFGIEGTGSYGAGLSRDLQTKGYRVLDFMRPNRQLRYLHGKSDSLDAEGAAQSVMNGQATAVAKTQGGTSEMIRHIKIARDSAVKAKSQAMITLRTLIINALAESMIVLFKTEFIHRLGTQKSLEALEYKTLEWVDWFNHQCLLEPIGNIPPAEAEANYYAALESIKMAA